MLMAEGQNFSKTSLDKSGFHILHLQVDENTEWEIFNNKKKLLGPYGPWKQDG